MILFEDRAASVLYKVLKSINNNNFLLPLNICPIVPDTFIKAGKQFEFIDINLDTLCIDEDFLLNKIKLDRAIGGLLFVKTFGINFDTQPLYKKIKEINTSIFIIDDMCPCIPQFDYDIENSYASMALFSSGYSKYVDIGYGGYGFLKFKDFNKIFKDKSRTEEFLEYKKKIMKQLPLVKKHKDTLNKIYKNNIPEQFQLGDRFSNWRFSILVYNKIEVLEEIQKVNTLFASSHYPQIDYNYVDKPLQNSNTNKIYNNIINLFNDFRFSAEQANKVVEIINRYTRV
jgi:dTDP-4-amino-4,6-dideoxygalactose transaminase